MSDSERMISPDFFPNPMQTSRTPQRETPPLLGGTAAPLDQDTQILEDLRQPRSATDDRATHALERLIEQTRAREIDVVAGDAANANGIAVVDMQGPAPGFLWVVRRINAGPVDYSAGATFSGVLTIGIKSAQAAPGNVNGVPADSGGQVFSQTNLFPAEGTWGRGELVLLEGERLILVITGLANNFQVTAGAHVQQYAAAVGQTYGL
jgi:hypothetical protein